jgi:hypothetical protein
MGWLPLILVGSLAGCGPDNGLALANVEGRVTYKGRSLTAGEVVFLPDDSKGTIGPPARGTISREGTYILSTEYAGDGALVGFHRVGLTGLESVPSFSQSPTGQHRRSSRKAGATSPKYALPGAPTLQGSIQYRIVTPKKLRSPGTSGLIVEVRQGSNTLDFDIPETGEVSVRP